MNLPIAAVVAVGAFIVIPTQPATPGSASTSPGRSSDAAGWWPSSTDWASAGTDGWHSARVLGPLVRGGGPARPLRGGPGPGGRTRCCPCASWPTATGAASFLTIILAVLGMFGTFLFLTYLLQTVDHYSPLKTGVAFLPLMAVNGLAATQLASRLMPHLPHPAPGRPRPAHRRRRRGPPDPADARRLLRHPRPAHRAPPRPRAWAWPWCPASAPPPATPSPATSASPRPPPTPRSRSGPPSARPCSTPSPPRPPPPTWPPTPAAPARWPRPPCTASPPPAGGRRDPWRSGPWWAGS